jgi:hypothetical protein
MSAKPDSLKPDFIKADPMLARLKPLPSRLRLAQLAALLRCEVEGSPRAARLQQLLSAHWVEFPTDMNGRQDGC